MNMDTWFRLQDGHAINLANAAVVQGKNNNTIEVVWAGQQDAKPYKLTMESYQRFIGDFNKVK